MLKRISISTNDIYQEDLLKEVVWNHFAKAAITGAFHRGCRHHSEKKFKKLKSFIVRKFSKTRLKFKVLIVQSKEAEVLYKRSWGAL